MAVALVLLFLPGLIAALLLRAPWLGALAIAPALSTTAVVLVSVTSSAIGAPWGPVPLVVGVLVVWLIAAVLGAVLGRYSPPEEPGRLPVAALVVTTMAAVAVGFVLMSVASSPEAFPQHPDTIYHLGVAQWMLEHKDLSFLHAEAFRTGSVGGAYQAAFHAMVATTAQLSGASVVVSASSFVLVIAGVAWPLGCVFLARTLFGSNLAVTLSAGVASVAFSAFPFALMGYGVLWPNLFGQTLLPAALGFLTVVASPEQRQVAQGPRGRGHRSRGPRDRRQGGRQHQSPQLRSRLRAMVLLLAALPGLAVAHPNALLTLLLFGHLIAAGNIVQKAWAVRRLNTRLAAASVAGLVMVSALAFFVSTRLEFKGGLMRITPGIGPELPSGEAVHDTLLLAPRGAAELWVLAALVAVGAGIILIRYRARWWVVAATVITSALFYLNVAVDTPAVRLLTWPWSNQAPRLAATVVLPATLLATVALATGARLLRVRLGLRQRASAVTVVLIFVVVTGGAYVDAHRRVLNPFFNPVPARSWASNEELLALHRLARFIPKDSVVAENPWNGGSYMYIVSGRRMLFPTERDYAPGDRMLLALSLGDVGRSPEVCAAAQRQHVGFAITGGRAFASALGKDQIAQYAGINEVRSSNAFRKVATDSPYTLYQMVKCAKA